MSSGPAERTGLDRVDLTDPATLALTRIQCPACGQQFAIARERLKALILPLICTGCSAIFRAEAVATDPPPRERPLVLLAHESAALVETVRGVLVEAGYDVVAAYDGESALERVARDLPNALVVDVALPGLPAFRLVDEIRSQRLGLFIVLIASVYSRTSYKRRPTSLHGADDYLEQHHLTDMLAVKLDRLLGRAGQGGRPPDPSGGASRRGVASPADGARRARDEVIFFIGERRLAPLQSAYERNLGEAEALARARRLAWLIVADIALYNEEALREGIAHGDLERRLGRELAEGRSLLSARVPEEVRDGRDLIGDALAELISFRSASGASGGGKAE